MTCRSDMPVRQSTAVRRRYTGLAGRRRLWFQIRHRASGLMPTARLQKRQAVEADEYNWCARRVNKIFHYAHRNKMVTARHGMSLIINATHACTSGNIYKPRNYWNARHRQQSYRHAMSARCCVRRRAKYQELMKCAVENDAAHGHHQCRIRNLWVSVRHEATALAMECIYLTIGRGQDYSLIDDFSREVIAIMQSNNRLKAKFGMSMSGAIESPYFVVAHAISEPHVRALPAKCE